MNSFGKYKAIHKRPNGMTCSENFKMLFSEITQAVQALTPSIPPAPVLCLVTVLGRNEGTEVARNCTLCTYFSCFDRKRSWGLEFCKQEVLAQCSREGKPQALAEGKTPPSF